ncbi:MAG TPA: sigma-70 family RNA polymerase sigma factor [Thermoleophilaceae bacterium]
MAGVLVTPRRLIEPARLAGSRMLLGTQSDERLVDLARAGYAAAFEAIVERYRQPLLRYCLRFLPSGRAEDAVQQAFASAYRSLTTSDAHVELRPWLYRIAHNAALNQLRDRGFHNEELSEEIDGVERPDQVAERRQRFSSVVAAVRDLPERQRDAILLREFEGRSYDEIAAALGVGRGAVRQLLHRARAGVRSAATALTPYGVAERLVGESGSRVAEAAAGAGLGAVLTKASAAVLVTGAVVGGATQVPHHHHSGAQSGGGSTHESVVADAAAAPVASRHAAVARPEQTTREKARRRGHWRGTSKHGGHSGDRSGSGEHGENRRERTVSDDHRSRGSTPDADEHTSGGGSSGSGSDDGLAAPDSSGQPQPVMTVEDTSEHDGSGTSGSSSGTSGSGSSGSDSGSDGTHHVSDRR